VKTAKTLLSIVTGIALGLSAGIKAASAADTTVPFTFIGSASTDNIVNISGDSGSSYLSGYAGIYNGSLNGKTVNLYCGDLNHDVSNGDTFTVDASHLVTEAASTKTVTIGGNKYYQGGLASAMTSSDFNPANKSALSYSARASEVAWLADNFQNLKTFGSGSGTTNYSTNQTAVNVAIWDIVQDGGDGVSKGTTQLDSSSTVNYSKYVSYYESLAAQHSTYTSSTAYFVQAPLNVPGAGGTSHYQDFIYSTALPTPEAGTGIAMGMLLFGGLFLFRRRNTASPALA
jgi:hypothetical protein